MTAPRLDSHQHFWRLDRGDYDWMRPEYTAIYRDFTPEDLKPLLEAAGVEKTIVVQAAATVAETRFLLSLAGEYDWVAAVVGWVDMAAPDAVETLELLKAAPRFAGIRPMIQDIADPDWMLKRELAPAFNWLEERQLTFDALVEPLHLTNLARLLTRHPGLRAVIDHGGKPAIARGEFDRWAEDMEVLAGHTQARCKLSGLLTEAGPGAGYAELQPYIDHLLECFGPARLMWGSDWPVLNLASGYERWVELCEQALAPLDEADRRAVWYDNAHAFYIRGA